MTLQTKYRSKGKEAYTIKFKKHDQDNINYIPFSKGDEMPSFLDYDEVLEHSIREGFINSEDEITSLCDGSDSIAPFFSSNEAWEEAQFEAEEAGADSQKGQFTYEVF